MLNRYPTLNPKEKAMQRQKHGARNKFLEGRNLGRNLIAELGSD